MCPKILIVDDNVHVLKSMKRLLMLEVDAEIFAYDSPFEALKCIETQEINLVLSDFSMPGMNGVELCNRAKQISPGIQCIIVSSAAHEERVQKALATGQVSAVIPKPWDNEELVMEINNALEADFTGPFSHPHRPVSQDFPSGV